MKKTFVIVLVLVFALGFAACSETCTLEGKWKAPVTVVGATADSEDNYVILEFKANGNGTLNNVSLDEVYLDNFTYTLNGDALTITTEAGKTVECKYKIEGETLTISTQYKTAEYTRFSD